jgi:hypothetical protein
VSERKVGGTADENARGEMHFAACMVNKFDRITASRILLWANNAVSDLSTSRIIVIIY